jgi:flagellar hook assembly protein FlgD
MGWDGRDDEGGTVPPGGYMVRLSIDTDIEGAKVKAGQILRTVYVAY